MKPVNERCCGLDVHKETVAACVRVPGPEGRVADVRVFGTMTGELLGLADWLTSHGVTHVAIESTGVFWKPVYYVLEERFTVLLVNPAHMKNVPGRKTDVKDCEWIAQLLEYGLLRASFVPPVPIRELRDLTRYRRSLIDERGRGVNRLQKFLQDAGIKLSSVASDVMGKSGRAMVEALVAGTTDAEVLADLARGRLRKKIPDLRRALVGRFGEHHRFLVGEILDHVDDLERRIEKLSARIAQRIAEEPPPDTSPGAPAAGGTPSVPPPPTIEQAIGRLDQITGVERRTAEEIIAELGTNMRQFPTPEQCASWAGICPGNDESAGKRRSGRTRKGDKHLRRALVQAALAAAHTENSYLGAQYHHLVGRCGHKRAVVAVAHSILIITWHLLSKNVAYTDLGADYFRQRDRERLTRRHTQALEKLGYTVSLSAQAS